MSTDRWRIAAMALTSCVLAGSASAALIAKGKPAPTWSGKTIEGKPFTTTSLKGKVVLLNFFSYS